jgi:hypothetical protein
MGRRGYNAAFWLVIAVPIVAMGATRAAPFEDCVRDGANRNFEAKTAFQRDLRDLIARNRPEFESLATVSMELQFLLAEARLAKVDYLLRHDANRIDTTKGLARFSNFEWSEADSAKLITEDSSFAELESRISTLRERNDNDPDWPQLRAYFRAELGQSPDFKAIMARFQSRQSDVENVIAECHHD